MLRIPQGIKGLLYEVYILVARRQKRNTYNLPSGEKCYENKLGGLRDGREKLVGLL